MSDITVIIVTYNSGGVIFKCLDFLSNAINEDYVDVVIVDNNSDDKNYLAECKSIYPSISVVYLQENMGFAKANNVAFEKAQSEFVLFLNPDAFVCKETLASLVDFMGKKDHSDVAICTPILKGYDYINSRPTGRYDSRGISRTWFGRYVDIGQGEREDVSAFSGQYNFDVDAICGAFMMCRLANLRDARGNQPFDENMFMYKEDIDLSLGVKAAGSRLCVLNNVEAFHCRGWDNKRRNVPIWAAIESVKNEWILFRKHFLFSPKDVVGLLYLSVKTLVVSVEVFFKKIF